MKNIIIILVIIILGGGLFYFLSHKQTANTPTTTETSNFAPEASSATFTIDDAPVTFSQGKSSVCEEPGFCMESSILPNSASGDLNGDGKSDTAVFIEQSGGGSGTFIYAAAYVSGTVNYKGTNAVFLGDRIAPKSLSIGNGVLTVTWLDRKSDEPFSSEPTVSTSKQFVYKNGELVEK